MSLKERIDSLLEEARKIRLASAEESEKYRIRILGKKGEMNELFEEFKKIQPEMKKNIGQALNELKTAVQEKIQQAKNDFGTAQRADNGQADFDMSRPVDDTVGHRHPLSLIREEIYRIFGKIGFDISDGPEIEDDWHLFTALNFAPEHPARDMQDTFFVEKNGMNDVALRTHTSSVQIRTMQEKPLPIRTLCPGRVYRNEAVSARAHCFFHQVEGLYVDKGVSYADLREVLLYFAKEMFGSKTEIRLRPSYFPFTEPSAEMDIACSICGGKGCQLCKGTGWVEILGCGMVDPNVLENCGIDPQTYSGFAFGMGVERIANLLYRVNDLRLFSENDRRFLAQF